MQQNNSIYLVGNFLLCYGHPSWSSSAHFSTIAQCLPIQNLFLHKIHSFLMFSRCRSHKKNPFRSNVPKNIIPKRNGKQNYGKNPPLRYKELQNIPHVYVKMIFFGNLSALETCTHRCVSEEIMQISDFYLSGNLVCAYVA